MYVLGETSVALEVKRNIFNQKFPSRLEPKKGMSRNALSDNRLSEMTNERMAQFKMNLRKARKSLTALDNAKIDHSVWMEVPLFATMGVSNRADTFYRNTIHRSIAQLKNAESINPSDRDVIDFYEKSNVMTLCLLVNVVQGLFHSIMFGWAIGVLNIPQRKMTEKFGVTDVDFAWLNGVFALGCVPGSLIGGALSDRWGRKQFLLANCVMWVACGVVFYTMIDYYWYLGFRFAIGMAAGGASVVVPTFLGEISPVRIRGAMGTSVQFCICVGILLSQFIAKWVDWQTVIALGTAPAIFQLFTAWTFMESPAWLILKDRDEEAEHNLQELRDAKNVDFELRMLQGGVERQGGTTSSYNYTYEVPIAGRQDGLSKPLLAFEDPMPLAPTFLQKLQARVALRKALIISIVLLVNQQFSGINSVFFYSASVFRSAGIDDVWLGTVLASLANVFGVLLALGLVENLGRKMCLILSGILMIIAAAASILGLNMDEKYHAKIWDWFTIGALMLYVIGFELGFGPIPWTIATELTPSSELATVQSIAAAFNGIANFIIALVFPHMQKWMQAWVYLPFMIVIALTIFFVQSWVPETKGLRVETVCEILRGDKTEAEVHGWKKKPTSTLPPVSSSTEADVQEAGNFGDTSINSMSITNTS